MEVIGGLIVAIVLVVAVWGLFGMWKVRSMNYDPSQQELIRSFVEHTPALRPDYENVLLLWRSFKDGG
jgi:hypothetical protein